MTDPLPLASADAAGSWLQDPVHLAFLREDAARQAGFFARSLRADGGFDLLDLDGTPLPRGPQELHTTTRMVHSFALARCHGIAGGEAVIDAGMAFLRDHHRDARHGGYLASAGAGGDGTKLAYGHMFVLLAAASAGLAGHPQADALLADVAEVLETRFWDAEAGLFRDEFTRDWQPFSDYRGMNANMHAAEAHLAAYEATGETVFLERAGRILKVFTARIAPRHGWRLPEHYTADWQVDPGYAGNPMFRPRGTTPGHSLELARLLLQHWDLTGRPGDAAPARARRLVAQAVEDAWRPDGGFAYTLDFGGGVDVADRYWWPVTEGIGVMAALIKLGGAEAEADEALYRRFWEFAAAHLVDHERGGWYPELDEAGRPAARQFTGKPDIYHSLQAVLFPPVPGLSRSTPPARAG
ncbi:AGE family epimerase/isomerase [Mangrovicoccus algicola]|uniref:AGE family epimerase/isomerase n=1 Tax=Mangrovicoccus algicola TaxID=2771008 RepID=A0A8J6Z1M6_9RHOB|nr:AGE family epimerase/isomerase [Mangrovicoccus algicola]MBE3640028.1 AGE family epimerase/isomerase [Mangrovicoccus algicola]